ncbi:MAG: hypothetical protein ACYDBJ_15060 [Aggregatilineales bacterium]
MSEAFTFHFADGHTARAARVSAYTSPEEVAMLLGLGRFPASLTIHGGAASTSPDAIEALRGTFHDQLAPLASKYHLPVLDGGTTSGVVGMMGASRAEEHGTFPLIGVVPADTALYPNGPTNGVREPLDPAHTHFALVTGGGWGIESNLLVNLGRAMAFRRVALLINGGEIARHEALLHARAGNQLLVLAGSGRVADEIVDALKRGSSDDILKETVAIGRIQTCTRETLTEHLIQMLHLGAA